MATTRGIREPPISFLRAFEAAVRWGSFSLAAAELCLTHGAISRRILLLEDLLGRPLFDRHARGVSMNEDGAKLYPEVCAVLKHLQAGIVAVHAFGTTILHIAAPHRWARDWFVPRWPWLRKHLPGIEMKLYLTPASQRIAGQDLAFEIRQTCGVLAGTNFEGVYASGPAEPESYPHDCDASCMRSSLETSVDGHRYEMARFAARPLSSAEQDVWTLLSTLFRYPESHP